MLVGWVITWMDQTGLEHREEFPLQNLLQAQQKEFDLARKCRQARREGTPGPLSVYLSVLYA